MAATTTFGRIKRTHEPKTTIAAELRLMPTTIETPNGSLVFKRSTE